MINNTQPTSDQHLNKISDNRIHSISNNDLKRTDKKPLVILIHGLHQRGYIMRLLAKRLEDEGFPTYTPSYYSLVNSLSQHSSRINKWLEKNYNIDDPIHLVGHSLGGLVIRDFISRYPNWKIDNCVTLGTPHTGSVSADYVRRLAPSLVGKSYKSGLDGNIAPLPDNITLGVIAGNQPRGLGQVFLNHHTHKNKLNKDQSIHDGSVYLSETRLPNAADHLVLPVTHTGMLMNREVADQTSYFLENGKFKR